MKRNLAPETKTAGAGAAAALATIVFVLNGWLHWFTPPPADVVVALSGAFSTLVGYVLPHTSRSLPLPTGEFAIASRGTINQARAAMGMKPLPASVIHVDGDPSKQPAVIKFEGVELTQEDLDRIKATLTGPHVQPPPATTTGGAS